MILIADSGSTKTDWCCIQDDGSIDQQTTIGLNPNFTEEDTIFKIIEALPYHSNAIKEIYFYGAGCGTKRNSKTLEDAFLYKFPNAQSEIVTDLVGAARACLGNEKGIIAILGTGSNSGVYDGQSIVTANPSLGHMLGDYGGGVDIGKQLLRDYFYKKMPADIRADMHMTRDHVIQKLYHEPGANTFIASQAGLIFKHAQTTYVRNVVQRVFDRFVTEEVLAYTNSKDLTINFVGSIAYLFQDILIESLKDKGITLGKIIQKPIEQLIEYHNQEDKSSS